MAGLVSTLLLLIGQYIVLNCAKRTIKRVNKPYGIQMCRALCPDSPDIFYYIQEDLSCHRVSSNYSAGSNRVSRKGCPTEGASPNPESGCGFQRGLDVCNRKDKGQQRLTRSSTTALSQVYPWTTALSPIYSRSSALPQVYPRTTALQPIYSRSSALSHVYPRTTTLSPVYSRITTLSPTYSRTTALSEVYPRTTALQTIYSRSSALSQVYPRTTSLSPVYSRTTTLSLTYSRSTALSQVYPRTTALSPTYSSTTLSSVPSTTFDPPKGEPEMKIRNHIGMSFDHKQNKFVKVCSRYGKTVTMYKGHAIQDNNEVTFTGDTLEECKRKCVSYKLFVCKSFDYGKYRFVPFASTKCYLSKKGYYDVTPAERNKNKKTWALGARDCE